MERSFPPQFSDTPIAKNFFPRGPGLGSHVAIRLPRIYDRISWHLNLMKFYQGEPKNKRMTWLEVSSPLKNMKVSWDYCSQYMDQEIKYSKPPTSDQLGVVICAPYQISTVISESGLLNPPGASCVQLGVPSLSFFWEEQHLYLVEIINHLSTGAGFLLSTVG